MKKKEDEKVSEMVGVCVCVCVCVCVYFAVHCGHVSSIRINADTVNGHLRLRNLMKMEVGRKRNACTRKRDKGIMKSVLNEGERYRQEGESYVGTSCSL